MDERTYNELVDKAFGRVVSALDKMDPDDVEVDKGGGYLTLLFRDGSKCVISTQRPVREIWMAADATAWHFSHDEDRWVARKSGEELFATVAGLVARKVGKPVTL